MVWIPTVQETLEIDGPSITKVKQYRIEEIGIALHTRADGIPVVKFTVSCGWDDNGTYRESGPRAEVFIPSSDYNEVFDTSDPENPVLISGIEGVTDDGVALLMQHVGVIYNPFRDESYALLNDLKQLPGGIAQ